MNEYELTYEEHSEKSLAESGRQVLLLLLLMPPLARTLLSLGPGEAAGWVLGLFAPWPHLLISTLFFFCLTVIKIYTVWGCRSTKPHRSLCKEPCRC